MPKRVLTVVADLFLILAATAGIWRMWDLHRQEAAASKLDDPSVPAIGARLPDANIDWKKTGVTLVLIMNKDCHYCSESAPFYQRLLAGANGKIQIAALFPHDVPAARAYLQTLRLEIPIVRGPVAFPWRLMTPTLLLCDATGKITHVWIGKLTLDQESEVFAAIGK